MRVFETYQKLILALIQYYLDYGYFYIQIVHYPIDKQDKWVSIDAKLSGKFSLDLNKAQRHYRKNKKIANVVGLRCKNLCLLLHTNGEKSWDESREKFTDLRINSKVIPLGRVVNIELSLQKKSDGKKTKFVGHVKFEKRSYQGLKQIVKSTAQASVKQQIIEMKMIKGLPAIRRRMHLQKEHLLELYRSECKRHGRKPMV